MFPTIETERLLLCEFTTRDAFELTRLYNNPEIQKYQSKHYYSDLEIWNYIQNSKALFRNKEKIMWKMVYKSKFEFIGIRIAYFDNPRTVEIQGDTNPNYWHQGLTREAYSSIIEYLKSINVETIISKIDERNHRAINLVSALNFTKYDDVPNGDYQMNYYSLNL